MDSIKEYLNASNFEIISKDANEIILGYNFDLVEIDAAKSFLIEESVSEINKEKEYQKYLEEIASDNLEDTLEEILEEFNIQLTFEMAEFKENQQFFVLKKM